MIRVPTLRARIECDHDGCKAALGILLVLMPSGGFIPDVPTTWQLIMDRGSPFSPYLARCPAHHTKIEQPTAPSLIRPG